MGQTSCPNCNSPVPAAEPCPAMQGSGVEAKTHHWTALGNSAMVVRPLGRNARRTHKDRRLLIPIVTVVMATISTGCGVSAVKYVKRVPFSLSGRENTLAEKYEKNAPTAASARARCDYWTTQVEDAEGSHQVGVLVYPPEYFVTLRQWVAARKDESCELAKAEEGKEEKRRVASYVPKIEIIRRDGVPKAVRITAPKGYSLHWISIAAGVMSVKDRFEGPQVTLNVEAIRDRLFDPDIMDKPVPLDVSVSYVGGQHGEDPGWRDERSRVFDDLFRHWIQDAARIKSARAEEEKRLAARELAGPPDYTTFDDIKIDGSTAFGKIGQMRMWRGNTSGASFTAYPCGKVGGIDWTDLRFSPEQRDSIRRIPTSPARCAVLRFKVLGKDMMGQLQGQLLRVVGP